jgi:hypothetical protein
MPEANTGMNKNRLIARALDVRAPGPSAIEANMCKCYLELIALGPGEKQEMKRLDAWFTDLGSILRTSDGTA